MNISDKTNDAVEFYKKILNEFIPNDKYVISNITESLQLDIFGWKTSFNFTIEFNTDIYFNTDYHTFYDSYYYKCNHTNIFLTNIFLRFLVNHDILECSVCELEKL